MARAEKGARFAKDVAAAYAVLIKELSGVFLPAGLYESECASKLLRKDCAEMYISYLLCNQSIIPLPTMNIDSPVTPDGLTREDMLDIIRMASYFRGELIKPPAS